MLLLDRDNLSKCELQFLKDISFIKQKKLFKVIYVALCEKVIAPQTL